MRWFDAKLGLVQSATSGVVRCGFYDHVATPWVPDTPVQSIADSTCSPALPCVK